jgi:hypothetical protein
VVRAMKERDQAKNGLEVEWVDTELYMNNGLWNRPLAADDALEKQRMDSLCIGPICL